MKGTLKDVETRNGGTTINQRRWFLHFFICVLLTVTACRSNPTPGPETTPTSEQAEASTRQTDTPTRQTDTPQTSLPVSTDTPVPTTTSESTATPAPTNTPAPTATPEVDPNQIFALNNLGVQSSGGLEIEILRVLIGEKGALEARGFDFFAAGAFDDKPVVGEVVFRVTNTTDEVLNVYPDQGTVVVNNEQIDLAEYMFYSFGDDVGGEIFPGVTSIGGVWFGLKRVNVQDADRMIIAIDAPHTNNLDSVGEGYYFEPDVSNHVFEPMPESMTTGDASESRTDQSSDTSETDASLETEFGELDIELDLGQGVEKGYLTVLLLQGSAVLLEETADEVQAGAMDGLEALGFLFAIGALLENVDQSLEQPAPDPLFEDVWLDTRDARNELGVVGRQWIDREITSADVPGKLAPVNEKIQRVLTTVEERLAQGRGISEEEIRTSREEWTDELRAIVTEALEETE